jgi:hypothetical protein
MDKPFYMYVDVDETFVRNYSTKRIPIPQVILHIRNLYDEGASLYCWSSGGAEYARESAREFGIEDCFIEFLPKPQVVLDDQNLNDWRYLLHVHPNECSSYDIESYRGSILDGKKKT